MSWLRQKLLQSEVGKKLIRKKIHTPHHLHEHDKDGEHKDKCCSHKNGEARISFSIRLLYELSI